MTGFDHYERGARENQPAGAIPAGFPVIVMFFMVVSDGYPVRQKLFQY
jgi:hypothetical protein